MNKKANDTIGTRKATPHDAADLAVIDNMASKGMSLAFWEHAVREGKAEDALVFARERFADPNSPFGWANAFVATNAKGEMLGAVTAYEMSEPDGSADQIKRDFPQFGPVFELFAHAVGDWFIDSMGVYPAARGKGVATKLMNEALRLGKGINCGIVALVVEDENLPALGLYEKLGFEVKEKLPAQGDEKSGNWLLMKRKL